MKFFADLHIHSKFSRATAKNLDIENLYIAAQLKGLTVVATGDFTHPGWFAELRDKLIPAGEGLFRLRGEIAAYCDRKVPGSCRREVRFILGTEISNIYKKDGRTRKNHNLVFVPNLEVAERFNHRLEAIGNIRSDGRPILGLDARNLLEIVMETSDQAFLIPAHIWTPWFSLLGSKSGFDSLSSCFGDLTPHIFAVETGLSSDPAMNWRVSCLDGLTLVSNSDAHSPAKLGREANLFDADLSYSAIHDALKTGDPHNFLGTVEFFPEEGKYHYDGHRKCGIRFPPEESVQHGGICPVCGKPLTLGVLYRVEELADRPQGQRPERTHSFRYLVSLSHILGELFSVGPAAKRVQRAQEKLLEKCGSELDLLQNAPTEALKSTGIPLLAEAIERVRKNKIHITPGFDGEYGRIRIFSVDEKAALLGQKSLFSSPGSPPGISSRKAEGAGSRDVRKPVISKPDTGSPDKPPTPQREEKADILESLNPQQAEAVTYQRGPLLIVAGPGTGKTRTLTHRIAFLLDSGLAGPENVLAVTFTFKAAQEMRERLKSLLVKKRHRLPLVTTFHGFCHFFLKSEYVTEKTAGELILIDEEEQKAILTDVFDQMKQGGKKPPDSPEDWSHQISLAKQFLLGPDDTPSFLPQELLGWYSKIYGEYQALLNRRNLCDYDDLILKTVFELKADPALCESVRKRFVHLFVDEYQDLNFSQYQLVRLLSAGTDKSLCAIGDPDQSIYGFRGSDATFFNRFMEDFPDAQMIRLDRNYRSSETILQASQQVIRVGRRDWLENPLYSGIRGPGNVRVFKFPSEKAEAIGISRIIEKRVGGAGFFAIDAGKVEAASERFGNGFADFAVLFRTRQQADMLMAVFEQGGIPYQLVSREDLLTVKGIAEVLSLFRIVNGCGTFRDLERLVAFFKPGIGKKTMRLLRQWQDLHGFSLNELLASIRRFPLAGLSAPLQLKVTDFMAFLQKVEKEVSSLPVAEGLSAIAQIPQFKAFLSSHPQKRGILARLMFFAEKYAGDASRFIELLATRFDTDFFESGAEKVSLMTLHAAKGLEFPVVFIAGCENGLVPFMGAGKKPTDFLEDRRLFYVGMTRARHQL